MMPVLSFFMSSPLEQFEVSSLLYIFYIFEFLGLTITTSTLFSIIFFALQLVLLILSVSNQKVVPTLRQYLFEYVYDFVFGIFIANIGRDGFKYFPFVFLMFYFVLMFNVFGLLPLSFTLTSQVVIVFALSFIVFIGICIIGLFKHKLNFVALFFPSGSPLFLAFLLVPIEIISFFSRPFSLAIRLFANMTAGHVLLKILVGFCLTIFSFVFVAMPDFSQIFSLIFDHFYLSFFSSAFDLKPLMILNLDFCVFVFGFFVWFIFYAIFLVLLISVLFFFLMLELLVAVLQAYVFSILVVIYIRDVLYLH